MKLTRGNSFNLGFEYDLHILGCRAAIPKEPDFFDKYWAWALKRLHGVPLMVGEDDIGFGTYITHSLPEVKRFIAYLTEIDPSFPGWEFTYVGDTRDAMLHPKFRAKMARYYEHWKQFKAAQKPSGSGNLLQH